MRTLLLTTAFVAFASCLVIPARTVPRPAPIGAVTFYESLSPHGEWLVVEDHGRVWRPHRHLVGVGFVPYLTGGHWVHTASGWAFEAPWEWAWLPFHYGRWYEDDLHGWVWVPDAVWATAWVDWRFGGGYVGWIPMPPRHHHHRARPVRWCFVESRHFVAHNVSQHQVEPFREPLAFEATAPIPPEGRVFEDEPSWSPGPPIARLRAEAQIEIPERELRPPTPLAKETAIFPKDLQPPREVTVAPKTAPEIRAPRPSSPGREPLHDQVVPQPRPPPEREQRPVEPPPTPLRAPPRPVWPQPAREPVRPPPTLQRPPPVQPAPQPEEEPRKKSRLPVAPTAKPVPALTPLAPPIRSRP